MTSIDPELYKLSERVGKLEVSDILPFHNEAEVETREFLQKIVDMLMDYLMLCYNRDEKVVDFHQPAELRKKLQLDLPTHGVPLQQIINDCATTLKYSVKTGHPHFMNQLSTGIDVVSMAGAWLTDTTNANMFTYEIAPVFIMMESVVLEKMRRVIGYAKGDSCMTPGGSMANMYAVLVARHKTYPRYKREGPAGLPGDLVIFCSDQSHYSLKTAGAVLGLGIDNCVMVPSDKQGRMIVSELERLIVERRNRGQVPMLVSATAGTTTFGAFDPLNEIADICAKYNLWFHVDAAWGGGLLLSKKYRHPRLTGIERACSVTWNPHKLMNSVLQCSTFHVREEHLLTDCNHMSAEYLFMNDKQYDTQYDTGDKVIQCGRHNDIFKVWLQWRAKGDEGFDKRVTNLMHLAEYQVKRIKEMPDKFRLLLEPEFVNVCFWYIPKRLRNIPHDAAREEELGKICPILKLRMMQEGTLMIGYQRDGKIPNFFRSIISQGAMKEADIDFMLNELDRLGEDL